MPTIRGVYLLGVEHLQAAGSAEPAIEAEVLLRHALRWNRTELYTRWESPVEPELLSSYQQLLEIRSTGRPVPYITGEREFMGLSFAVDERVMIPRPETEILVEFVIEILKKSAGVRGRDPGRANRADDARLPTPDSCLLVDVGTGSGCIAVSLAYYLPNARVYATDISKAALQVAAENARRHRVADRTVFLQGDLLAALPDDVQGRVDAVAANPPYVPVSEAPRLPREIREFEPGVAVFTSGAGTSVHARLIEEAPRWLGDDSLFALEVGAGQAEHVRSEIVRDGRYGRVHTLADLGGIARVVTARTRQVSESDLSSELRTLKTGA